MKVLYHPLAKKTTSETFERKPSLSDQGRITEVVCSFANTKGGKLLISISDKGKIVGVEIGNHIIERLADMVFECVPI